MSTRRISTGVLINHLYENIKVLSESVHYSLTGKYIRITIQNVLENMSNYFTQAEKSESLPCFIDGEETWPIGSTRFTRINSLRKGGARYANAYRSRTSLGIPVLTWKREQYE
jgi:hypothetical protein